MLCKSYSCRKTTVALQSKRTMILSADHGEEGAPLPKALEKGMHTLYLYPSNVSE